MLCMAKKSDKEALIDNLTGELRRGSLVLAVLSQLKDEQYGYSLKHLLEEKGLEVNEGTLYPLLRRLEKQGLLESDWRVIDEKRPRRYYKISELGSVMLLNLSHEWEQMVRMMNKLLIGHGGK